MESEREEWRPVAGYEGRYEVSNLGRVRSLDRFSRGGRFVKGKMLKPNRTGKGQRYRAVGLYDGNGHDGHTPTCIHRIVAEAFIPNPEGKREVNHKDNDGANNCVTNLEWVTTAENGAHRRAFGPINYAIGERAPTAKLTPDDVRMARAERASGRSIRSIARRLGVDHGTVSSLINGETWSHVA
jgi:hypothetical protein